MAPRSIVLALSALALASSPQPAFAKATPAQKCQAAKLKAIGAYQACLLGAQAKSVLTGNPADAHKCEDKLSVRFSKAEQQADGECPTQGDEAALKGSSDDYASDVLAALGGNTATCGNLVIDSLEECDGTDVAGKNCISLGFGPGTLDCTDQCQFDTTDCAAAECNILTQDCSSPSESCYVGASGLECLATGTTALGEACDFPEQNGCGEGLICLPSGPDTGTCYEVCDPAAPNCSVGTCFELVKLQLPGIGACDPNP
jgi:hypothetical protein